MHHRNQAADERRRRILLDESCSSLPARSAASISSAAGDAARPARSYTSSARASRQPRLVDLVPMRWPIIVAVFFLGDLTIAGLHWLAAHAAELSNTLGPQATTLFEPAAAGSLARWLASLWLLMSAAASVIVYTVRRHKADDYRGSYRVWLWAAGFFVLAGLDAATSAHRLLSTVLMQHFGTPLGGNGSLWWIGTWGLLLAAIGGRLTVDLRASRTALAAALLSGLLYAAVAAAIVWPNLPSLLGLDALTMSTILLAAHFVWLAALTLTARYVYLDSQGLIAARAPKKSRREKASESEDGGEARARRKRRRATREEETEEQPAVKKSAADEEPAETKPRRFLFWRLRSAEEKQRLAEEKQAARQLKEDEREARREAKLAARRAKREEKEAARSQKQSTRDEKQAARAAEKAQRQEAAAERKSKKSASSNSRSSSSSQPLSAKMRRERENESASSSSSNSSHNSGSGSGRPLSKAERKRLKKEQRRQLREQAA